MAIKPNSDIKLIVNTSLTVPSQSPLDQLYNKIPLLCSTLGDEEGAYKQAFRNAEHDYQRVAIAHAFYATRLKKEVDNSNAKPMQYKLPAEADINYELYRKLFQISCGGGKKIGDQELTKIYKNALDMSSHPAFLVNVLRTIQKEKYDYGPDCKTYYEELEEAGIKHIADQGNTEAMFYYGRYCLFEANKCVLGLNYICKSGFSQIIEKKDELNLQEYHEFLKTQKRQLEKAKEPYREFVGMIIKPDGTIICHNIGQLTIVTDPPNALKGGHPEAMFFHGRDCFFDAEKYELGFDFMHKSTLLQITEKKELNLQEYYEFLKTQKSLLEKAKEPYREFVGMIVKPDGTVICHTLGQLSMATKKTSLETLEPLIPEEEKNPEAMYYYGRHWFYQLPSHSRRSVECLRYMWSSKLLNIVEKKELSLDQYAEFLQTQLSLLKKQKTPFREFAGVIVKPDGTVICHTIEQLMAIIKEPPLDCVELPPEEKSSCTIA